MNRFSFNPKSFLWSGVFLVLMLNVAFAADVETLDAQVYRGEITTLDAKGLTIKTADGEKTIPTADVSKMVLNDAADLPDLLKTKGQTLVLTQAGDVLPARANVLRMEKSRLRVDPGEIGLPMELSVDQVKTILLPATEQMPEDVQRRCEEMQITSGANDVLVIVGKANRLQQVTGTLLGISDGKIAFTYRGKERTVKANRVRAIIVAKSAESATPATPPTTSLGHLTTTDGCVYAFSGIRFADGLFTLQRVKGPAMNFSPNEIARITFLSDRLVNLAELKPASVKEHSLFDKTIPHRVNRAAGGGPLLLAGKRYDTGLGLHSFCELTYDLGGAYRVFLATAGIDDAARPNGDATLTILGDDKTLLPTTILTGKDAPQPIRLSVRDVKTLTIRVDFGPDKLDVADHVDLAGAKLVK